MCTLKDWAALVNAVFWPLIVVLALLLLKTDLVNWVARITDLEVLGWFKLTKLAETTKTTATALSGTVADFDRIAPLLDWNKVGAEVRKWAARNYAPNPADMGPENFRRFLSDIGLPGGQPTDLKWEGEGANRRLVYQ